MEKDWAMLSYMTVAERNKNKKWNDNSGILQAKLAVVLVLLKLVFAVDNIDKVQYFKSLTPQERQEIFNTDDVDHVPEFEIIDVEWPKVHKRSFDESIPIIVPLAQGNVNLNLKVAAPLIGPNTPVYTFRTRNGRIYAEKNTPFKDYTLNIYEDEDQQASMVVNVDADGNKYIHSGIIESHNISIHRAPNPQNTRHRTSYIVRLIDLLLFGGQPPIRNPDNVQTDSPVIVPAVIYPEILVIVDSTIYDKYDHNFDIFKNYILNFWTAVNQKYKPLSGPKYKLSIAGIAVAEDRNAFQFMSLHSSYTNVNFDNALNTLGAWLYNNDNIIPIESYDVAMVHTLLSSSSSIFDFVTNRNTVGLANLASACQVNNRQGVMKKSIIFDDNNYGSIYTAAHELGHMLGSNHDDNVGCGSQFIMSSVGRQDAHLRRLTWSQCSINGFRQFLRTNPTCLFNVPESYQKMMQATTTPRPEVYIDNIYNPVDTASITPKRGFFDDASNVIANNRRGRSRPIIPVDRFNQFIPQTNSKYSDLARIESQHGSLSSNFEEFTIDLQNVSPDQIIYGQIVNKSDLFIFILNKPTQNIPATSLYGQQNYNGLLAGNNNGVASPLNNNYGVGTGNPRISVSRQPIAANSFPERVPTTYNNPKIRNNNGAAETGFIWIN
ncbi:uncharacterized protein [Chelonus insularis]|uniref:uncharacterized protein n=1 Tax=Chelonus insularis TaxID=460826 RepID=UPI00158B7589|nr:uncharacterized protein LOC118065686 [Chelonus insularis]